MGRPLSLRRPGRDIYRVRARGRARNRPESPQWSACQEADHGPPRNTGLLRCCRGPLDSSRDGGDLSVITLCPVWCLSRSRGYTSWWGLSRVPRTGSERSSLLRVWPVDLGRSHPGALRWPCHRQLGPTLRRPVYLTRDATGDARRCPGARCPYSGGDALRERTRCGEGACVIPGGDVHRMRRCCRGSLE